MEIKPLVSYCLLAYNQEKYIEDAVKSALAQTYSPMEIIISDDGSSDETYNIIEKLVCNYTGPNEIILNRNSPNLGIREHCNKVLYDLAKGDIMILAAGDDVSHPQRVEKYVNVFERFPEVTSISCLSEEVDVNLKKIDNDMEWDTSFSIYTLNDYVAYSDFIIYSGDSRGLRRTVIEKFPPLEFSASEDIFLFIRSLMIGSGCFIREPLVKRRNHDNNVSKKKSNLNNSFIKQVSTDIDYAYQNNYISKVKKEKLIKKIFCIKDIMELYWYSPFTSFRTFFYRCLSRLFHVKKNI